MPHTRWWRCIPPTTTSWRSLLLVLVGIVLGGVLGGLLLLVLLVVVVEVARLPHRRSPFRYITSGQAGYALPLEKLIDSASRSRSHLLSPCFLPFAAGLDPCACEESSRADDPAYASVSWNPGDGAASCASGS